MARIKKEVLGLYILRNARTREPVRHGPLMQVYEAKDQAKAARNSLMIETGENFIVSPGPHHKRWRG